MRLLSTNKEQTANFIATKYTESKSPIENDNSVLKQQTGASMENSAVRNKKELKNFRNKLKETAEEAKEKELQDKIDRHKTLKPTVMPTALKESLKRKKVLEKNQMSPLI